VTDLRSVGTDVVGNLITPDDQKRKIEIVVEAARQVWSQMRIKTLS
jgi:hypothetical protein